MNTLDFLLGDLVKSKQLVRKEDGDCALYKYSPFADCSNPILNKLRGTIFYKGEIVCHGFDRFFNYGSPYCTNIDWDSVRVQEKIDGSILKLWYHNGKWRLSTNGMVDAYKVSTLGGRFTFGELFDSVFPEELYSQMPQHFTYIFEIVSPENQIVLDYGETKLYHLGSRNMDTGQEQECDLGIQKPKTYSFKSVGETVAFAEQAKGIEGFVVVDANYNRIKIKTQEYLALHRICTNNFLNRKRVLDIVLDNNEDELIALRPDVEVLITEIANQLGEFKNILEDDLFQVDWSQGRKTIAQQILKSKHSAYLFEYLSHKIEPIEWLKKQAKDKKIKILDFVIDFHE